MGNDYEVGWGKPPKGTQFPKGACPNRKGRPKGSTKLPYEEVFGRLVWITEDGERYQTTAETAFLKKVIALGYEKGGMLLRYAAQIMTQAKKQLGRVKLHRVIYAVYGEPGEPEDAMRSCGMAILNHPASEAAKWVIEPWLVQQALARLGDRRLTEAEQAVVLAATRKPHLVNWPVWWTIKR